MNGFLAYYLLSLAYCMIMSFRRWNRDMRDGGLGVTPGLDTMAIVFICWALAPIDIALTWIRLYREAEEARRGVSDRNDKII